MQWFDRPQQQQLHSTATFRTSTTTRKKPQHCDSIERDVITIKTTTATSTPTLPFYDFPPHYY